MIMGTQNSIKYGIFFYETKSTEYVLQRSSRCHRITSPLFYIAVRCMDTAQSAHSWGGRTENHDEDSSVGRRRPIEG